MKRTIVLIISLLIFNPSPLSAQFKNLKKQSLKAVKKQVKPLEIDFKVKDVKYNLLKAPNKLTLKILFDGHNPNKVGLKLNRIEFELYINDELATKFYNDKKIKIPKKGDFTFEETAELKMTTIGKAGFNSILKKKAVYRVDGTYFIDSKFGTFSFKAKLVEKELNK